MTGFFSLFPVIRTVLLLVGEEERRSTFTKGILCLASKQMGEGKELFLSLLLLNCLQLKIILMLKWHILGWNILIP